MLLQKNMRNLIALVEWLKYFLLHRGQMQSSPKSKFSSGYFFHKQIGQEKKNQTNQETHNRLLAAQPSLQKQKPKVQRQSV